MENYQNENLEKTPEKFPSYEEIKWVFERVSREKQFKELRIQRNDQGEVVLYEVEVRGENGEKSEYNFQKAKNDYKAPDLPATARFSASVHRTDYEGDMPVGGECVANYLDGKWEYPQ